MRAFRSSTGVFVFVLFSLMLMPASAQQDSAKQRPLIVISDLHIGLGRDSAGKWNPTEDFRWTRALQGLLEQISRDGEDQVDLVIAGDLLELWQRPENISCAGDGADLGCTIDEMKETVRRILAAHKEDFQAFASFSQRGRNHIFIIPGNHDSSLLVPEIREILAKSLGAESGRITFVESGVWASTDGQVVIEHGHQIGSDVNRYKEWPKVTARSEGVEYLIRPWGELFVQKLFNEEEKEYEIIDNLSPEATGVRYRMADRGLWKSVKDVARLVAFNLFETSFAQKWNLGKGDQETLNSNCDRELGYRLFMEALPPEDPFRIQCEGNSPEAQALREQLDQLAKELSDEDLAQICVQRRSINTLGMASTKSLGGSMASKLIGREKILRRHIEDRMETNKNMKVFLYGHTHQIEEPWDLRVDPDHVVKVLNSGAFQRLVDTPGFLQRSKAYNSPQEGLRRIKLEDLAPCYSVAKIALKNGVPEAEIRMWHMPEEQSGEFLSPGAGACK